MHVRSLLAAYAPEDLIQGQDCPARGRESYSADDILRLREAFSAVRQDRDSRCSAMAATARLLMGDIEKFMRDYDFSYADTALFLDRNGISVTEQILRYALANDEEAEDMVSTVN